MSTSRRIYVCVFSLEIILLSIRDRHFYSHFEVSVNIAESE
jgi:hypothetical protein